MKKSLTVFVILISGIIFGQFTIKESSADWKPVGKLYHHISLYSKDGKAKFIYIDQNKLRASTSIFVDDTTYEYEFSTEPDTLDKLYLMIKDHFENKKVEKLTLEFPEGNLYLNFSKNFGSYGLILEFDNESSFIDKNSTLLRNSYPLNMKSVNSLFGKSKS